MSTKGLGMTMKSRRVVRIAGLVFLTATLSAIYAAETANITADEALARLKAGNERFATGKVVHPNAGADRRAEVAKGQKPFAIVVGCSDSRVGPEAVFDQGLGDLFVIRTAGNVVDDVALGSIEYAADHFAVPVILVLGHTRCGAVIAAVGGGEAPGHIGSIVTKIKPAVDETKGKEGDAVDNAIRANVRNVVNQLRGAVPILSRLVKSGKLKVVGACYDLDTGRVDMVADISVQADPDTQQLLLGNLHLVGKHGPLSIYLDQSSTNAIPEYAVFEGNRAIVYSQNLASNVVETSYFENGFGVLTTKHDGSGRVMERIVSYSYDNSVRLKYTYIDTNGDGFWDIFLNQDEKTKLVRSNLCWVSSTHW